MALGTEQQSAVKGNPVAEQHTKLRWRVGLVGLGKLGTPVALAMSLKGHDVMGFDVDEQRMQKEHFPHRERGPNGEPSIEPLLRESQLKFGTLGEVGQQAEVIL